MVPKKQHGLPASLAKRLPDLENCESALTKCFWALKAAKLSPTHPNFIRAEAISEILLEANVSLAPLSVQRALARAGSSVARRGSGSATEYQIMGPGERQLEDIAGRVGPLTFHITGKAPWSDRRFVVKEALKKSIGEVRVLDKYFGMDSLDFLQDFEKNRRIKFSQTPSSEHFLPRMNSMTDTYCLTRKFGSSGTVSRTLV
jgi:hypothetical protein